MSHPGVDELARVPLFEGLTNDQLASLASRFEVEEFQPGHSPARAGDHGYVFFVLAEGTAHVEMDGQVLEQLGPGSAFGEMAFFAPNSRRSATVVPETPLRVFTLFGTDFRTMQVEYPQIAHRLEDMYKSHVAHDQSISGEHA